MATGVVSPGLGRKNDFGKAVSRFLSSSDTPTCAEGEDHLSERSIPGTCSACAEHGAGRSEVPYLALHPMGFSVPPRLLSERWALTPPFHPYPLRSLPRFTLGSTSAAGVMFSVALSVKMPRGIAARVYLRRRSGKVTRHRALWRSDFPPLAVP